jgi:ribose transport system substrate-binding protein
MRPLRASGWLAAPALFLLCGCGGTPAPTSGKIVLPEYKPAQGKIRVGFVSNNPASFWTIAEAGARKAEADLKAQGVDVEVSFLRPAQGDAAEQKKIIDNLLNQDIHALSVSVIDPKNQTPYLDEIAAKVPLIAVDNDAPRSKRLTYLGTNNYAAGRAAGKLIKKAMPEGGVVVIFVGDQAPLNARQRRQGVIDELGDRKPPRDVNDFPTTNDGETLGKYKLHGTTYTDQPEGEQKARQNATTALTELQNEKNVCMVGLWAYNPPAILGALKDFEQGKLLGKVKVVGFDEDSSTLKGIKDGHIFATVVQQPFRFGHDSVKKMVEVARKGRPGGPPDEPIYVPYRIVMKDVGLKLDNEPAAESAEAFGAELDKLLGGK